LNSVGDVAINGEIRVNGMPIGSYMGQISGYVYQEDWFVGTLTVAEHLAFMVSNLFHYYIRCIQTKNKWFEFIINCNLTTKLRDTFCLFHCMVVNHARFKMSICVGLKHTA